jgi:hypothetical protein
MGVVEGVEFAPVVQAVDDGPEGKTLEDEKVRIVLWRKDADIFEGVLNEWYTKYCPPPSVVCIGVIGKEGWLKRIPTGIGWKVLGGILWGLCSVLRMAGMDMAFVCAVFVGVMGAQGAAVAVIVEEVVDMADEVPIMVVARLAGVAGSSGGGGGGSRDGNFSASWASTRNQILQTLLSVISSQ